VNALTFKEGKVIFRNRFVRTKGFKVEARSGKIEYRWV
jgi:carotenoid cleavage dioxygenase-like enzyme